MFTSWMRKAPTRNSMNTRYSVTHSPTRRLLAKSRLEVRSSLGADEVPSVITGKLVLFFWLVSSSGTWIKTSKQFNKPNWPSVDGRRGAARWAMFYKITSGLAPVKGPELHRRATRPRRGHSKTYGQYTCRHRPRTVSFLPINGEGLNALPTETAQAPSIDIFKLRVPASNSPPFP